MFSANLRSRLRPPDTGKVDSRAHPHCPWDSLERFVQELNACDRSVQQIQLALDAVRENVDADAVFYCSDSPGDTVEVCGDQELPSEWCRRFVRKLLAETPGVDGQLLRSSLPPATGLATPSPRSAALVRLSRSRSSWIVALRFRPGPQFGLTDMKIMSLARRMLLNQRRHSETSEKLKETVSCLVHCLTEVIDAKLPYTCGHSERVALVAARLAQQMRLPIEMVSDLYFAGLLHDIGTLRLPEEVLLKPDRLTEAELAHVREAPVLGDRLLARIKPLERLRPAVRHQHERYDGAGYPDHLASDAIPLMARILSVAESCDAMLSPRPYRPSLTPSQVETILADGAGKQWDPAVVEHFMACRADLYPLCRPRSASPVGPTVERALDVWSRDSSHTAPQQRQQTVAGGYETIAIRR